MGSTWSVRLVPRRFLPLTVLLAGCVARPGELGLHYPPIEPERVLVAPQDATHAPAPMRVPLRAEVGTIHDARPRARIGEERARHDIVLRRLETPGPIEDWIRRGFVHELTRAEMDQGGAAPDLRIDLRLTHAYVTSRFQHEAELRLQAWIRCAGHGKVLAMPVIEETAIRDIETEGGAAEALAVALRQALVRLIDEARGSTPCPGIAAR